MEKRMVVSKKAIVFLLAVILLLTMSMLLPVQAEASMGFTVTPHFPQISAATQVISI